MRQSHYVRFSKGAGIGCIHKRRRRGHVWNVAPLVKETYVDSIDSALREEQAADVPFQPEDQLRNAR